MPVNFGVREIFPHRQVSGRLVCFLQFTARPPHEIKQWLLPAIKDSGNAYRPGPPGFDSGWHIHNPREVAKRLTKRWPELADRLLKVARQLERHPEEVSDHRGEVPKTKRKERGSRQRSTLDHLAEAALGHKRIARVEKV